MQLFSNEKLNSFLTETVSEYLSRVNLNGNSNNGNGKRNGKQALTWEEAWQRIAEEYAKYVCSLEPTDFSKLKLVVDPGTRSDNTAVWLFKNGCYQEVKLKHFLSQAVKLLLEEDLRALFGLDKSEIVRLFLEHYDDSKVNNYTKKLVALSPQRKEVDWNYYIRRGFDVIWLSDGRRIIVNNKGKVTLDETHQDHNLFCIPANISTKDEYQEPSFFLNLVENTFGEASSAWLDLMALLLSPSDTSKIVTFLVGPANSGKSTWLDIFELIYGSSAVAPITLKHLSEKSFHLSRFLTKLVVFAHETSRERAEDSTLKWIASRDVLFVDRKFLSAIEGRAIARLVVATNTLPVISDYSDGFVERVWFFNLGKLEKKLPKPEIFRRIEEEAPDIRRYLILRLAHLRKHGLSPETTDYLKQERQKFLILQNVVAAFLMQLWNDEINLDELVNEKMLKFYKRENNKLKIAAKLIWPLFVAWCKEVGREPLAKDNFFTAIRNLPVEYLPFRVSNKQIPLKFNGKVVKGYRLTGKTTSKVTSKVTSVTSGGYSEVTVKPLGDKQGNPGNLGNPAKVAKNSDTEIDGQNKNKKTEVTQVTEVTSLEYQGFQGNLQKSQRLPQEVTSRKKRISSKQKKSPDFFPPCVGDDFSEQQQPFELEVSSEVEEETEEEVFSPTDEAVPLEEEAEEEQEPIGEEERVCLNCMHFPGRAGDKTGKVCKKTEELTWWDSKVCKYFEERKSKGEAVKRAKKNKVKTPEELLAKYGDKIKQVLEIMNEAAKVQKRNKSKTEAERMMFLRRFSVKHGCEPRCYNCNYAIWEEQRWFCQLHETEVPGLDLCDGWEPFQRRAA